MKKLKGGTFNLKFGRNPQVVKGEINRAIDKHNLDFLVVQEAADYTNILDHIAGYQYYTNRRAGSAGRQVGILVRDTLHVDRAKMRMVGDGWTTITGAHHGAVAVPCIRINKWLKVTGLHMPTPSAWPNGVLVSPRERRDDIVALARYLVLYFAPPAIRVARMAVGDWNESPKTKGRYAPRWIAETSRAKMVAPSSTAGHGRIDWPMFKGCRIRSIYKDNSFVERSDHQLVVFVVTKK